MDSVNAERSAEETADGNYYDMVGRLLQVDKNKIIIKLKCTLRDQVIDIIKFYKQINTC
jgi:hypothetical protein